MYIRQDSYISFQSSNIVPKFQQSRIIVEHVHLPSFAHAARYIQHFENAGMNTFDYLTWDGERDDPIDSRRRDLSKFHLGSNLFVHASDCTNNFRLCLKVAASHQWSVAHLVRDDEWSWIVSLLVWAEGVFSCDELPSCMLTTDCKFLVYLPVCR